jgi:23S rRNA (uracil1939-C5)-methyltransferase
VTVEIIGVNLDGDGLARIGGRLVTVPGTIPGERVEVRPARGGEGQLAAEAIEVVAASPHRVAPGCRHFGPCGGCAWQHIAYGEQLRLKRQLLHELLGGRLDVRPTLGTPPAAADPVPADDATAPSAPWHYRNKVAFVFGPAERGHGLVMGHYRRGSRRIVPVEECPVHAEAGNRFAFALRDSLVRARVPGAAADASEGIARHAVARVSEGTGELLGTLVVTENVKPLRRVTADMEKRLLPDRQVQPRAGFHLNLHDRPGSMLFGRETRRLFGLGEVREQVAGASYLVSPTAFFQTNVRAAEVLVQEVLGALPADGCRAVLDLYAGVGLFALPLARQGRSVTAVEENRDAMASAATAMRLNRVAAGVLRLVPSRVEDAMPRLSGTRWDAVILDPPRQGCPPVVLDWVFNTLRPARVVYVSCNPEALARDAALVPDKAYRFERIQPIDMFPHTSHIETVAVLERRRG